MSEYEKKQVIQGQADSVFAFVTDLNNLPKYLPTVQSTSPQQGERIQVHGHAGGQDYDSDGYFRVERTARRMEWGSDGENQYSGWLQVTETGHNCEVTVHLSFVPRPDQEEKFKAQSGSRDRTIEDGMERALQSIANLIEGKGGKVESPAAKR